MKDKAKDLVYLNTQGYISIDSLRIAYWRIIIFPICMLIMGMASINNNGMNLKSLFPIISVIVWSLIYWIFVFTIQCGKIKNTFELRFLVNGISGLLVSSMFWLFFASWNLIADNPILDFGVCLWLVPFYVLISAFVIAMSIFGVHKGIYRGIKRNAKKKSAVVLSAIFSSLIPLVAVLGRYTAQQLRNNAIVKIQTVVGAVCFILGMFLPILAHINFVQYYYCKKYRITCDEYGNNTSPKLKKNSSKGARKKKSEKKR